MLLLLGAFLLLCPLVISRPDRIVHPLNERPGETVSEPAGFRDEAFRALGFLLLLVAFSLGVMTMLAGA
ncbi:hypothetical protein QWJ34_15305 [Saccharibacillus sp. CPCC 101409]|uniref:hypothetical protein n=1 Tax=Saccharibacillus sp. CPCC 101409 TaxID=3058041 RepID=UPI002673DD0D|nr:hypothetical protein [Saccharibacillus sp. CPCC 101409]MDO3411132.1 hypothetical protein [Saccharibacillus sp. CPCC 101409]